MTLHYDSIMHGGIVEFLLPFFRLAEKRTKLEFTIENLAGKNEKRFGKPALERFAAVRLQK